MAIRIECQSCKNLVDITQVDVRAHAVRLVCPTCEFTNEVRRHEHAPEQSPERIVTQQAQQAQPSAIAQAGAKKAFAHQISLPANVPDTTWVAFQRVLDDYENQQAHDAFLATCAQSDALAAAGGCYRAVLDKAPGDPFAERAQQKILTRAMAMLDHSAFTPEAKSGTKMVWVFALLFVFGCVGVSIMLLLKS